MGRAAPPMRFAGKGASNPHRAIDGPHDVLSMFRMRRISVTAEQLATAILVWLRVAPQRLWLKNERFEQLKAEKRQRFEDVPDPKKDLAAYLAGRFAEAKWEISYEEPKHPGSPPPKRPEPDAAGPAQG